MAEQNDINIVLGIDTSSTTITLNEIRKRLNQLQRDVNSPFTLTLNTSAAKKKLDDLFKSFDGFKKQVNKDIRNLPAPEFNVKYGSTKTAMQKQLKESEDGLKNQLSNLVKSSLNVDNQLQAITSKRVQRETQEAQYLTQLRKTSDSEWVKNLSKAHSDALKEDQAFNKARAEAEASRVKLLARSDISMPSLRYALYDIAGSAQQFAQVVGAAGSAVIKFASDYETAATNIQRTTLAPEEQLQAINRELISLSEQIPVSFVDLAGIATMGAQLGIEATNLAGFSKTVAEFSAATNVSTESAAQSFGALGELLNISASEYQNLGSSIAYVGINSVATETQIISVAEAIGGVANSAGLSADYVVGLSGALASLKVPAEQSRGALTRIFSEINRAAAGTGVDIQLFANVLGVTADEAKRLAQSDMQTFFTKFVNGLSGIDSTQLTTVLDQLNLADIRVTNTLTRLSRNTDLVAETLNNANSSFEEGSFLSEVYALRVDDLASKLQILQNSLANLGANVGATFEPVVKLVVDGITQIVQGLNQALSTEAGKTFTYLAGGAVALAGSIAALVQGFAMFVASLGAVRFALKTLGWESATGGFKALAVGLFGAKSAADATSASMGRLKFALASTGVGLAIVLIGTLAAAFMEAGQSADSAFQTYVGSTTGLAEAVAADRAALTAQFAEGNYAAAESYAVLYGEQQAANSTADDAAAKWKTAADVLGIDVVSAANNASLAIANNSAVVGENTAAWLAGVIGKNEAFQELANREGVADVWAKIGADFTEVTQISATQGEAGVRNYFIRLSRAALEQGNITIAQFNSIMAAVSAGLNTTTKGLTPNAPFTKNYELFGEIPKIVSSVITPTKILNSAIDSQGKSAVNATGANEDYAGSIGSVGGAAGSAAAKIRTLTDYAGDLSTVWERARDIRFSGAETIDKVTSSFQKIAKATADAREEIAGLQADTQQLQADQALQQYFLSVAEAYGDTLKAQEIRANLAKIDSDLTKKTKDLQKAQDKTNKTLVGNSEAAIDNRSEILGLVASYQDHIKALAASGMSQDALRIKTEQLKADFLAQATQLGYNVNELGSYAAAFDDVTVAINNVPRDITVTANTDPAIQALNEFVAKARSTVGGGVSVPISSSYDKSAAIKAAQDLVTLAEAYQMQLRAAGNISGAARYAGTIDGLRSKLIEIRGYATGGYINGPGGGTSDSVMARVSNGEYVVRAAAVSKYGVGFFDRLNQMQSPRFASGGYVAPASTGMVSLSPEDRALLRNIGGTGEVVLYADSRELARSVNDGNKMIVAQGGRP